jgi:uncharacterized membrane protein YfcA
VFPDPSFSWLLLSAVAVAAILYSSVGHGGASGYLAVMALFGLDPAIMKPAALTMNIFVTTLLLVRLIPAGHFNWRLFTPFIIASIPLAFVGGAVTLDSRIYKIIVGLTLLLAMWRMLVVAEDDDKVRMPSIWTALPVGGVLGFVSGLTGVGGGIFLSPLLLIFHWATIRGSAAIAAAFILVNSIAGIAGYASTTDQWPQGIPVLVVAAVAGAMVGSELCVRRLAPNQLRKALAIVLAIAGIKMLATT